MLSKPHIYAIVIARLIVILISTLLLPLAFILSVLGRLGDLHLLSHSRFITATKQLLTEFDTQISKKA